MSPHVFDIPKRDLVDRYNDLREARAIPTPAELANQIRGQHTGDVTRQAIGLVLLEKYAGICGLGDSCWNGFLFETVYLDELDKFAKGIRDAERLAAGVLEELRAAGFKIS